MYPSTYVKLIEKRNNFKCLIQKPFPLCKSFYTTDLEFLDSLNYQVAEDIYKSEMTNQNGIKNIAWNRQRVYWKLKTTRVMEDKF